MLVVGGFSFAQRFFEAFDRVGDPRQVLVQRIEVALTREVAEVGKVPQLTKGTALERVSNGALDCFPKIRQRSDPR